MDVAELITYALLTMWGLPLASWRFCCGQSEKLAHEPDDEANPARRRNPDGD